MGATFCCITFGVDNYIAIGGIVINSVLAIWIVKTIQNRLTNKRVLKDHFIVEIKEIRAEYKSFLNCLYSNKKVAKSVIPWFKLMNIKINDILDLINEKYKIDKTILNPYQNDLRDLITENEDFIRCYESENPIDFSEISKSQIIKFQQDNNRLFNEIIVKINDED